MKEVKYTPKPSLTIALLKAQIDFRRKYRINDAAFFDLIYIYDYFKNTGKGITASKLRTLRYKSGSGTQAIQNRKQLLVTKGLIKITIRELSLTELAYSELTKIVNVTPS